MHPQVRDCLDALRCGDAERVLRAVETWAADGVCPEDLLLAAEELIRARHPLAAETALWQLVCRVPPPTACSTMQSLLETFPVEYRPSPRLVKLVTFFRSLPPVVGELCRHAGRPPFGLIQSLRSEAFFGPLIETVSTSELYPKDSPGCGWGPIHAIRILGEMRVPEAVDPLLNGVLLPEIFDYAHAELAHALGRIGAPAVEPAQRTLDTDGLDEFQLITLMNVLRTAALVDPAVHGIVSKILLERGRNSQLPPEVRGFALRYLVEIGASEHFQEILRLAQLEFLKKSITVSPHAIQVEIARHLESPGIIRERLAAILNRFDLLYQADPKAKPS